MKKTKKTKIKTKEKPKKITKKILKKGKSPKKTLKKKKAPIWEPKLNQMKDKLEKTLKKLKDDLEKKVSFEIIEKDNNELLLLLGECNYLVREFHEHATLKANKLK
ncbi:MAG: hypothetical protein WC688_05050 [Parachlamydiales bacterium]|jgi:hypothetical protein